MQEKIDYLVTVLGDKGSFFGWPKEKDRYCLSWSFDELEEAKKEKKKLEVEYPEAKKVSIVLRIVTENEIL